MAYRGRREGGREEGREGGREGGKSRKEGREGEEDQGRREGRREGRRWGTEGAEANGRHRYVIIGVSLSEPHTSVTSLPPCVCMFVCLDRPLTVNHFRLIICVVYVIR